MPVLWGGAKAWAAGKDFDDQHRQAKEDAQFSLEQAYADAQYRIEQAGQSVERALGALGAHQITYGERTLTGDQQEKIAGSGLIDWLYKSGNPADSGARLWRAAWKTLVERAQAGVEPDSGELDLNTPELTWELETYDDWYELTRARFEDEGSDLSWEDYLREAQLDELGDYGIMRAELELSLQLARRKLDYEETWAHEHLAWAEEQHRVGTVEHERARSTERSAAAAMGMRSGSATVAAQEYTNARTLALATWVGQQRYAHAREIERIGDDRKYVDDQEAIGIARLDRFLEEGRAGFSDMISDTFHDMRQLRDELNQGMSGFNNTNRRRFQALNFFQGFSDALNLGTQIFSVLGGR